ncbi:MAG: ATP-binding protein [Armatimonadota bacterium]
MYLRWDEIVLIAISLASAVLAVAVFSRAPDRVWNRLFAVQAVAVSAWVALNFLLQNAATVAEAGLWLRLTHPVSALVICTFADIFWVFPEKIEPAPLPRRVLLYGLGALVSCVALAPNLYKKLEIRDDTIVVDFGWPFLIFGIFAVGVVIYSDWILVRKLPRLSGLQRVQVGYVLAGVMIGQSITLFTNVLLPLIWQNTYYSRWGAAAYVFVIGFVAYAIAKHGIIRPAVAFCRVAAYLLTASIMVPLAYVCAVLAGSLLVPLTARVEMVYLLVGIALGCVAVPVHQQIRRRLERAMPGAHLQEAAQSASNAILRTLDGEQLPDFLCGAILGMLKATHVSVFTLDSRSGAFVIRASKSTSAMPAAEGIPDVLPAESILLRTVLETHDLLDRTQIRRFQTLHTAKPLLTAMRHLDAEVVTPVLWEDKLIGLVLIGERMAGDMYDPEELQMLRNLLPQISLAVRNAQLFDEVVRMKEYNENILREMQSGVIAVNGDQQIVTLNPAAEEMLGLQARVVIGKPLDLLPEKIAARLALALSGHCVRSEERLEVANGRGDLIPIAFSTSRWRGSSLSEGGAIGVISDLTLVEELEQERLDAEHLSMIRLLSAGMAHELRNPLVAIRTFAELLPTRWDDDEFRVSFLSIAQEEIERIDRLLTDLLMLSKPADAVVEELDVDVVCTGVVRSMSAGAQAKHVQLVTDLQFGDQPFLGDRGRLHQALVNLLKNAIEAEPEGGCVKVSTSPATNSEAGMLAQITIHNTGSYIPQSQIEEIFHPFCSQRQGGTGLGLSVCQTIIEEHHGLIRVISEPETGTAFIVELPIKQHSAEEMHGSRASQ